MNRWPLGSPYVNHFLIEILPACSSKQKCWIKTPIWHYRNSAELSLTAELTKISNVYIENKDIKHPITRELIIETFKAD